MTTDLPLSAVIVCFPDDVDMNRTKLPSLSKNTWSVKTPWVWMSTFDPADVDVLERLVEVTVSFRRVGVCDRRCRLNGRVAVQTAQQ